jgi:hypothetical protein
MMPQPNAALQIANVFREFAQQIEDYRHAHVNDLSDADMATLRNRETSLRNTSNDYLNQGINAVLDNGEANAAALTQIGDLLKRDQTKLNSINKAIEVAGILSELAMGFASGQPGTIASALQSAFEALKPAEPDKTKSVNGA